MEFRFVAYDRLGAQRGVLPNPLEALPVVAHNDLSTLTLSYDRLSPKNEYLDNDPEIALERLYNNTWVEIPGARFRYLSVDFDHLNEQPVRAYTFIHVGEALSGVTVYSAYGLPMNDEGAVQWKVATPGKVISNIWANAMTRGFQGFSINFTATTDSSGQPWAQTFSMAFDVDTTLSAVLHRLVALGLCDYRWSGRQLQLFNADTTLGVDQTITATPVSLMGTSGAAGVDSAPEETDNSNLCTHVIVLGEEGKRWVFPTGWIAPEGRREIVMSYSGVDDEGTALLLATPTILKGANELKNTTRQFHLTPDNKVLPFETYNPGNWVWVHRGLDRERMRIRLISLQIDSNGVQGFVTLGDKIDETLELMYEQIQRITGGVSNQGTSTPGKPPGLIPVAPSDLTADATPYIDKYGNTQGVVLLGFVHDQKDGVGNPVQIDYYPTWYRTTGTTPWKYLMQIDSNSRSGTFSPLPAYDRFGIVTSYDFAVAAMSSQGIQSGIVTKLGVVIGEDTVAPPKPDFAQSNVTTKFGSITVNWNGKGRSVSNVLVDMPADFKEAAIYQFTDAAGGGKTRVGTLLAAYEVWATDTIPAGTTRWYGLSAFDITGNESAMSPLFSVTPSALVDEESIRDELEQAFEDISDVDTKANNALTIANQAQVTADGRNSIYYDEPLPPIILVKGDTWLDRPNGLIKVWSGTAWVVPQLGEGAIKDLSITNAKILNLDGGKLTADSIKAISLKSKSIGTDKLLVGQDGQIIDDPFFEAGLDQWQVTVPVGGITYDVQNTGGISKVGKFIALTASGPDKWLVLQPKVLKMPIEGGQKLTFKINYSTMYYPTPSSGLRIDLIYYLDNGSTPVSTQFGDPSPEADAFLTVVRNFTAPANAYAVSVNVTFSSFDAGEMVYIAGIELTNQVDSTRIAPGAITVTQLADGAVSETKITGGAITTPKLAALAITAEKIASLAIETGKLAANAVDASKINAGSVRTVILIADSIITSMLKADAITAKHTMTGATLQTIATANRGVKITTAGINAYSSAGVNTFKLDSSTGDMLSTGIFQTAVSGQRIRIWNRANLAAIDFYPDTTDAHGAMYSFAASGVTATEIRHFTNNSAWSAGIYLESTGRLFLNGGPSRSSGLDIGSDGVVALTGKLNGGQLGNSTFCVGGTAQLNAASGGWSVTYGNPASSGNRGPLCQADAVNPVSTRTANCTASSFNFSYSSASNSSVAFRYMAYNT